jgi:hypothetical protein
MTFANDVQNFIQYLLSRLTPHAEEIIGVHHCGFRRNRSTTAHIFCIRQIRENNIGNSRRVQKKTELLL